MEKLKGKTILIGKEEGNNRLVVALSVKGQMKMTALNSMGSVPASVSRCKPLEDTAHCKIEIDLNGDMKLTNMKLQNVTYVNGVEISSKRIYPDSKISLGKDEFPIHLSEILEAAEKIVEAVLPPEYDILPLKNVWENYHNSLIAIKKKQKSIGLLRSIPVLFSMTGGLLTAIVGPELRFAAIAFTVVAVLFMIYGFYRSYSDKSIEETEDLNEKFQNTYVCPNGKCHHFLGNVPYNVLRQHTNCPYCKAKFKENQPQ